MTMRALVTGMPRVSVVIPTLNRASLISETLDSILASGYRNFEIIVVDDGSTDETPAVIATYGTAVRYIRQQNAGQGAARNTGIQTAQGEYIAFVDSDDLWLPDKLFHQVDVLDTTGSAWVYCDGYEFDGLTGHVLRLISRDNRLYTGDVLEPLLWGNFIASPTPVVRRSVFEEVGYFDQSPILRNREDWDMWLRIAGRYPIQLVDKPLVRYRVHPGGATSREPVETILESKRTVVEGAIRREPERLGHLRNRVLWDLYVKYGRVSVNRGEYVSGRGLFAQAIRLAPTRVQAYVYWALACTGPRGWNLAAAVARRARTGAAG